MAEQKTNKEEKDEQIGRIMELAGSLGKSKAFKEESVKRMSSIDRATLLESLAAERQFLNDFALDK
jgi:hypothetical protein